MAKVVVGAQKMGLLAAETKAMVLRAAVQADMRARGAAGEVRQGMMTDLRRDTRSPLQ